LGLIRVLVTRPEPGATRTAERLQRLGFEPIKLPLTEIVGLETSLPATTFDAVIATSANAFLYLPKAAILTLAGMPVFVVGEATAKAAKQAGFHPVQAQRGDVEGLLAMLKGTLGAGDKVLYLAGKVRRPDIEETLADCGVEVDVIEVYDTKLVSYSTENLKFLADKPISAVLLTSVTSAEALAHILKSSNLRQLYEKSWFICLSNRIADALKYMSKDQNLKVDVCARPDEDAIIEKLIEPRPV
jgi:uroporphyrinogen-III synthase